LPVAGWLPVAATLVDPAAVLLVGLVVGLALPISRYMGLMVRPELALRMAVASRGTLLLVPVVRAVVSEVVSAVVPLPVSMASS